MCKRSDVGNIMSRKKGKKKRDSRKKRKLNKGKKRNTIALRSL